jgi:hypothetical protein
MKNFYNLPDLLLLLLLLLLKKNCVNAAGTL